MPLLRDTNRKNDQFRLWRRRLTFVFLVPFALAAGASQGADVTYYYVDQQGSVLATTDAQGNILSRTDFRPFGEAVSGAATGPGYTGHVHDDDLIYMQARYYDAVAGRFLTKDIVTAMAGSVASMNRYAYVANNPINRTDPSGNYDRGGGWTKDGDWDRFDKSQKAAARDHHAAADKLWAVADKLSSGQDLTRSDRRLLNAFESVMGKGSAKTSNLYSAADNLSRAASILDAGPGSAYKANAVNNAGMQALGKNASTLAAAQVNGNQIFVNTEHPAFGSKLEWAARHEPLHTVGLTDQKLEGHGAYKYDGDGAYFYRLSTEEPDRAVQNPDHLTDFSGK